MPDRPMRVALVAHRVGDGTPTGIGRHYIEVARAIAAVADPATHEYVLATPGRAAGRLPLRHQRLPGGRLLQLGWGTVARPRVDRSLRHPDVVHALHPWAPVPSRAPLVCTVHDLMPLLQPEWHGRREGWLNRRGIAYAADHAVRVIAVSRYVADLLVAHTSVDGSRITVVHNGVGDAFRVERGAEEIAAACARHGVTPGRYLIAIGAVSVRKNLRVVLHALSELDPGLLGSPALLVAGPPGVGIEAIQREVDALGLRDRVRFGGYVDDGDLPLLLRGAVALVHPSKDEGFGIPPVEAMAAGRPAVVSAAGSLPEIAGDAALVVDPEDAQAWAGALHDVLVDADLRERLVQRGAERHQRFRWETAAAATIRVHTEALAATGRTS